jgi:pyridoxal biosynthesis lyase PdxS
MVKMQKHGVIMDVMNVAQVEIAEAGALAVVTLEKVPAKKRRNAIPFVD